MQSKASYAHDVAFRYLITADQSAHYRSVPLPSFFVNFKFPRNARTGIKKKKKRKNASVINIAFKYFLSDTIFFKRIFKYCKRLEYFLVRNTITVISERIILYPRPEFKPIFHSIIYLFILSFHRFFFVGITKTRSRCILNKRFNFTKLVSL